MNTYTNNNVTVYNRGLYRLPYRKDNYTHHVKDFQNWLKARRLDLSEEAVRQYIIDLNNSDYAASTKRIKRQAVKKRLRQMMETAEHEEYTKLDTFLKRLDQGETAAAKINDSSIGRSKVLDSSEYRRMVHEASPRTACFIAFLWQTGCRVAELVGIKHGHIPEKGEKTVTIRVNGKGNKERKIKITRDLYDHINSTFRGELYLFETQGCKQYSKPYITSEIGKVGRRAIGRHVYSHMLRHSFATRKVRELPGKLDAVSKYLGHSSVSITLGMYCHNELADSELLDDEELFK